MSGGVILESGAKPSFYGHFRLLAVRPRAREMGVQSVDPTPGNPADEIAALRQRVADREREVIATRQEAKEETQQTQVLLQAALEANTDAVYVKDATGRYLVFNS